MRGVLTCMCIMLQTSPLSARTGPLLLPRRESGEDTGEGRIAAFFLPCMLPFARTGGNYFQCLRASFYDVRVGSVLTGGRGPYKPGAPSSCPRRVYDLHIEFESCTSRTVFSGITDG